MKMLIILVVVALVPAIVFVYTGISESNKEAKEKAVSEKPYTVWSAISGFAIGFFVILYDLIMDIFIRRRSRY